MALMAYLVIIYYMYSLSCSEDCGRGSQVRDGITDWVRFTFITFYIVFPKILLIFGLSHVMQGQYAK